MNITLFFMVSIKLRNFMIIFVLLIEKILIINVSLSLGICLCLTCFFLYNRYFHTIYKFDDKFTLSHVPWWCAEKFAKKTGCYGSTSITQYISWKFVNQCCWILLDKTYAIPIHESGSKSVTSNYRTISCRNLEYWLGKKSTPLATIMAFWINFRMNLLSTVPCWLTFWHVLTFGQRPLFTVI